MAHYAQLVLKITTKKKKIIHAANEIRSMAAFLCKLFKSVPFLTKEEGKAEGKFPHCVVKRRHTTAISVHIAIHIKCENANCE